MRSGVVVAMVAVAMGCGQGPVPEEGPPPSGGLNPNNVGPPQPGPNGACNDLSPAGGTVVDQIGTSTPALGGGTLTDGRYILTRYEWYTPNQLHARTITLVVSGGGAY